MCRGGLGPNPGYLYRWQLDNFCLGYCDTSKMSEEHVLTKAFTHLIKGRYICIFLSNALNITSMLDFICISFLELQGTRNMRKTLYSYTFHIYNWIREQNLHTYMYFTTQRQPRLRSLNWKKKSKITLCCSTRGHINNNDVYCNC